MSDQFATWASSQSIFQLAVAVNLAVSAIFILFESPADRQIKSLHELKSDVESVGAKIRALGIDGDWVVKFTGMETAYFDAIYNIKYSAGRDRTLHFLWLKVVAFVCAGFAAVMLVLSSLLDFNGERIGDFLYIAGVLCLLPTFLMMGIAILNSLQVYCDYDSALRKGIDAIRFGRSHM